MKTHVLRAMTAVLCACGIGATGLGLASGTAQAEPYRPPTYQWCPGDFWDPHWGFNWEWLLCHDDWHRGGWGGHRGGYGR